jgi:small-conductance mechanosensitive channel
MPGSDAAAQTDPAAESEREAGAPSEPAGDTLIEPNPPEGASPEIVRMHELGDSSVNLVVRPWVARDDYWDVHWDVTREVKLRFDREGISIPYPQQDLHLKLDAPAKTTDAPMEVGRSATTSHDAPETDD